MAAEATDTHHSRGLERLIVFSDGVFAIAITLLALDIKLPGQAEGAVPPVLGPALLALMPQLLGYVISFLVISNFWVNHHRKFRYIRRYDTGLLWLNLIFLMSIAFLPVPTAILGDYGADTAAVVAYAAAMALTSLLAAGLWWYALERRLTDLATDRRLAALITARGLVPVAVFLLSLAIAPLNATAAMLCWLLITPGSVLMRRLLPQARLPHEL